VAGSLGKHFAVLNRKLTGDPEESVKTLESKIPVNKYLQIRAENRLKNRMKRKKPYLLGARPPVRTAV